MCGIAGIVDGRGGVDPRTVERMRDRLAHRGPDAAGLWRSDDGRLVLAHRRLAIVDLSATGAQPMAGPGGTMIVFNGEIYNHRALRRELETLGHQFVGTSDTLVLLAAYAEWGEACLDRLVGMFAFALWDSRREILFCARDRMGEKPFYYRHDGRRFAFASELKALLEEPGAARQLDVSALNEYLAYGYVPGSQCILQGYAKLPAASVLRFDPKTGEIAIGRYWSLPAHAPVEQSVEEWCDEVGQLIEQSVAHQIEADVPVGILLSGGLDSSLIAAAAARATGKRINTFTIGFPDSPAHDESAHASLVADFLGSDHQMLPAEAASLSDLPALIDQYDEPFADSSLIPTFLVSRLVRKHCTVALGGDGGDELFGGYLHYPWIERFDRNRRFTPSVGEGVLARILPLGTPGRGAALAMASRFAPEVTISRLLDPAVRGVLAARGLLGDLTGPERGRAALVADRLLPLDRATALDAQVYMCDDILVKVDRASMLNSLEVRAPMLDHRIVELAFGRLPLALRAAGGGRKLILRHLARRWLPPEFDAVRKQGFAIPIAAWLAGPWAPMVAELRAGESPLFDKAAIANFLDRCRGNDRAANRVFQLLMLEAWRKHYNVSVG